MEPKPPTGLDRFFLRWPLYVRIGFGLLIVFGLVGNCAGRTEGSIAVFVLTALMWVCSRILQEAIDSWRLLGALNDHEAELKKQSHDDADK